MEKDYFYRILSNLEPYHLTYKENISELHHLAVLIHMIKTVQYGREQKRENNIPVDDIDDVLKIICDRLADFLEQNKRVETPFEIDFQQVCYDFYADVRSIDAELLPPLKEGQSRPSWFIPQLLVRTSKRISTKLLKAMTKGTNYRDYSSSMSTGLRAKRNRHIAFIGLAWTLALLGTVISIGFLTRDFIKAQSNLAIQVDRSKPAAMALPGITICPDFDNIPTFFDFPTAEYPGLPLFTISMYRRINRSNTSPSLQLLYPDSIPGASKSPVENVTVSKNKSLCIEQGFDVRRELESTITTGYSSSYNGLKNEASCLHCFRIGVTTQEVLEAVERNFSAALFLPAVQIKVSKPRLLGACFSNVLQRQSTLPRIIRSELYEHAEKLEAKGILDFAGGNYSALLINLSDRRSNSRHFMDFYCNVYFFSGFFYPNLDNANISYRYSGKAPNFWEKAGSGPYFSAYTWERDDMPFVGPKEEGLRKDSFSFGGLRLYAEDVESIDRWQPVSPSTGFANIDRHVVSTTFTFKKMIVDGRVEYRVTQSHSVIAETDLNVVDLFSLGFDFELFEVERVYTYSTMTLSEFVTDIFEFLGLFTGICIFTLVVAPANRKLKTRNDDKGSKAP